MSKVLNPKQKLFAAEYLVDLNATQAAIRAGYSKNTANEQGARLLVNVSVRTEIDRLMMKRSEKTEITAEMVLKKWWEIANADPRDLIEYHNNCCRYCYGVDHQYQWEDLNALERAKKQAIADNYEEPSDIGGFGYNPTLPAVSNCPKCFGRGFGTAVVKDTRKLSPQAAALYAGLKVTKDGLDIRMQDQSKALENVARHLGMFVTEVKLIAPEPVYVAPKLEKDEWMMQHLGHTNIRLIK